MSFKAWVSIVTAVLLAIVLFLTRHEIVKAWDLLGSVNLWILALLIPLQLVAYFAAAETLFEYLRSKNSIKNVSRGQLMRMALEMNFVNHVLPSGGVSGISYMSWRLGKLGVSAGRATAAQAVRYSSGFAASIVVIAISVLLVTIDGNVNRWVILVSTGLVFAMIMGIMAIVFLVSSKSRSKRFSAWLTVFVNNIVRKVTRGKKRVVLREDRLNEFFDEIHDDYIELRRDRAILVKPFLWALLFTVAEGSLFWVTFLALGQPVNPGPIIIAYVLASIAGFIVVTPGGAGAYEAIMVTFLALAGISSGAAIAGILLTRVIILLTTIGLGYVFYQQAILKYGNGKPPTTS